MSEWLEARMILTRQLDGVTFAGQIVIAGKVYQVRDWAKVGRSGAVHFKVQIPEGASTEARKEYS